MSPPSTGSTGSPPSPGAAEISRWLDVRECAMQFVRPVLALEHEAVRPVRRRSCADRASCRSRAQSATRIRRRSGGRSSQIRYRRARSSCAHQMRSILASAITLVQRAISAAIRFLKSSGVPAFGSLPSARMRSTTAGSATSALISLLSRAAIVARQLRRSDHAHPRRDGEAREARLGDGADVRQRRKARVAGDADGVQRAGLDLADQRDRRIDQEVDAACRAAR